MTARVFYEVFGAGESTPVPVPSNPIVHSHSTKQVEDCVAWGLKTSVDVMLASKDAPSELTGAPLVVLEGAGHLPRPATPSRRTSLSGTSSSSSAAAGSCK
jgi:hypothetical protein